MTPFYGLGSTASRLFLPFTTKFPEIPGTYLIDLESMKGWVNLGAIQWICGDYVYIYEKWHSEVNLRQLARSFQARKHLFKNVSRHTRMLLTWPNTNFQKSQFEQKSWLQIWWQVVERPFQAPVIFKSPQLIDWKLLSCR